MKKLLGLTFILTSMVALSAPQGSEDETATMNISATVIKPLTVVAEPMDFGQVIQKTEGTARSRFTINGEEGQIITVNIPKTATLKNSTTKEEMTVSIATISPLTTKDSGTSVLQPGDNVINVVGTLPASQTTETGTFEGTLVATVKYN